MSIRAKRGQEAVSVLMMQGERVLLVRRDGTPGKLFPHTWTLPGDEIAPGETVHTAAQRVAAEQMGIETLGLKIVAKLPQPAPFQDERGSETVLRVVSHREPAGEPTREAGWFSSEELRDLMIFREGRDVLRKLMRGAVAAEAAG